MAWSVTASEVKTLTGSTLADGVVESFITASEAMVTKRLTDQGYTDAELKQIHLFLSAHILTANRERQGIEEKVDPASIKYADIFGPGLKSTTYGQTALQLDSSGELIRVDKKKINVQAVEEKHELKFTDRQSL